MKSMRQAYDEYVRLYVPAVETGSVTDALLRGAFSAGVLQGLGIARLSPSQAVEALDRMRGDLETFWKKEPQQ